MRVLVFNLALDADDPVLGFTTDWVNALAARVEHVSVITMRAGRIAVADNVTVRSVGKELGRSEPRRIASFYRAVRAALGGERPQVAFAHMIPLFAVLFSPVAKVRGIPVMLWYAHGAVPPTLRVAERLVDCCVTSTPEGFRARSEKLVVLQQGIDVERFSPPSTPPDGYERSVVCVGRLSPVKRVLETIDAVVDAGEHLRLHVVGGPLRDEDRLYERRLQEHVDGLRMGAQVRFYGAAAYCDTPAAYRRGGIYLNLSQSGSLDKTILEAMASGCIPVSSNDAFRRLARAEGWEDLACDEAGAAAALRRVCRMPPDERRVLRAGLRRHVVERHGLPALAGRLVAQMESLSERA